LVRFVELTVMSKYENLKRDKTCIYKVFLGILYGISVISYAIAGTHVSERQEYYLSVGIQPNMDPRVAFPIALLFTVVSLFFVVLIEILRSWV